MNVEEAIEAAERLLPGTAAPEHDTDPRWQAMIRISEFIRTDPEPVWQFVTRWGGDPDGDLRMAVACGVLEHLLEDHFAFCFPVMSDLARRDRLFATTVQSCWSTLTAEQKQEFRALGAHLETLWGQRLDDLVPDDEPHGTFHDAFLSDIQVDSTAGTWACAVDLCVGDPDGADVAARDHRRPGVLTLNGLRVWSLPDTNEAPDHRLWLTSDGALERCPVVVDRALVDAARGAKIAWFLFLADLNAFAYVAADSAQFTWR
jgi:hypothetical protein